MSMSDTLADMLTRIRNGQRAGLESVVSPSSKLRKSVLDVLVNNGYLLGYKEVELRKGINELKIELKYHEDLAVIKELKKVSKPGKRVYSGISKLPRVYNGLGIWILSTPKGVMCDKDARQNNVGGEIIAKVF